MLSSGSLIWTVIMGCSTGQGQEEDGLFLPIYRLGRGASQPVIGSGYFRQGDSGPPVKVRSGKCSPNTGMSTSRTKHKELFDTFGAFRECRESLEYSHFPAPSPDMRVIYHFSGLGLH